MYRKLIKGQTSTLHIASHTISSNDLSMTQNTHAIFKIIGAQGTLNGLENMQISVT